MIDNNTQFLNKKQVFLLNQFKKVLRPNHCLIGIDYGNKRIGLALSDTNWQVATPFKVIYQLKELDDIVASKNPAGFVIGLPLETNGNMGKMVHQVFLFTNRLIEKYDLPVCFIDERYTSQQALERMQSIGVRPQKQRSQIDTQSAQIILQYALDRLLVRPFYG